VSLNRNYHSVQKVFVILLMGLFVILSLLLVLLGTKTYQSAVERSEQMNVSRVMQNYVRSVLRSEDKANAINTRNVDGIEVLSLSITDGGKTYIRNIYCSDGWLMESYVSEERLFKPEDGEKICKMSAFSPEIFKNGIMLHMRDSRGDESDVWVAFRADIAGH